MEQLVQEFYKTVPLQQKSNDDGVVAKLHSLLENLHDILIGPFWEQALCTPRDPSAPLIFVPGKVRDDPSSNHAYTTTGDLRFQSQGIT